MSINKKNLIVLLSSFWLCSCVGGCLEWLKGLCSRRTISSNISISSNKISNNPELNKSNEKKYTHEDLYIIGDIEKCKKVMEKLDADSYSENEGVIIYKKEILDDEGYYNTFRFYLCGNEIKTCEKIHQDKQIPSYIFFLCDISDSNSLNKLGRSLNSFKKEFEIDISSFFLILLKIDSQKDRKITVKKAENFCEENKLKFFGEIDTENNTWDYWQKDSLYDAIIEICEFTEKYQGLWERKEEDDHYFYQIKDGKDVFIMFLCAVREAISTKEGELEVKRLEMEGKIYWDNSGTLHFNQ